VPVVRVVDPADPRLADYARLSDAELLRSQQLFVAEGRLVLERVLADPALVLRSVLLNDSAHRALQRSLAPLAAATPIYVTAVEHFLSITGFNIHRGCLALVERPPARSAAALAQAGTHARRARSGDQRRQRRGVFRNAAAFGVDAVLLSPPAATRCTARQCGPRWRPRCRCRSRAWSAGPRSCRC
jgi:tRNA G18 (ribose-2'-O)-methylase SpoU